MNKTTEALKLAEEALASIAFEKPSPVTVESLADIAFKALRAIREALAEPVKQEPKCSMSKHTPGPWKVGKYLGQGGWVVHMDVVDRGRGMDIVHGVAGLDNDERLANARLIAAAPDLLKAFSDVYLELAWDHLPPAKKYLAENARAAIAKATGGAEHEKTKPVCETCESLARTVMMDQTGKA